MDDVTLRRLALDVLGPLGDPRAREALEQGAAEVEPGVATWEGSHGAVMAHRVTLVLPEELHARVTESPAVLDALAAAFARAIATPLTTLYDFRVRVGRSRRMRGAGPYR